MKQRIVTWGCLAMAMVMLTGCGRGEMDRTLSGAGIGGATGLVAGAVVGGSATTGLLIGAGAGALAGALTEENQINLGKPFWR